MIVCVCKAVSDRHIKAAVKNGAVSLRDIARDLRVGTCCGKCLPEAKAALYASLAQSRELAQRKEAATLGCLPQAALELGV